MWHRSRRPFTLPMVIIAMVLLVPLGSALDIGAQSTGQFQAPPTAVPTEDFNPGLQARHTPTPPPRATEEPEDPGDPPEDPTAEPTEEFPLVIADPATITLNKGACDDPALNPEATDLAGFQTLCHAPDGEFEFTVSNADGFSATDTTSLGTVQFEVPTGPITITETLPPGWGDPAVFCWSNLLPTPASTPFIGNGPSWNVATGEQVECWWLNITDQPTPPHSIQMSKLECPAGTDLTSDYWTLAFACTAPMAGIGFALTTGSGTVEDATDAAGAIEWTGVDLGETGEIQIDEAIPAGYTEPAVWCVNFPVEAADAQDFDFFPAPSVDGLITVAPEQHAPFIFGCTYFNLSLAGGGGNLADPSSVDDDPEPTITLIKRSCPHGDQDLLLAQFNATCPDPLDGVEFTLTHGATVLPGTTVGGEVSWTGVPAGTISIQESVPPGYYPDPIVFCGYSDEPGGSIFHISQVVANGGLIDYDLVSDSIDVLCYWFNLEDPSGATVTLNKRLCPPDVATSNLLTDYLAACGTPHDGVEFTLNHAGGTFPGVTSGGSVQWTGVPIGPFSIQETVPPGFGDPLAWCGFAESEGGGLQHPAQVPTPGGLIGGSIAVEGSEFICYVFNMEGASGGPIDLFDPDLQEGQAVIVHDLTLTKRTCPAGTDPTQELDVYQNLCPTTSGVEFTIEFNGGATTSTTSTDASGEITWLSITDGPFELRETNHFAYAQQLAFCYDDGGAPWQATIVDGAFAGSFDMGLAPGTGSVHLFCDVVNMASDTTATLTVIKHRCPLGVPEDSTLDQYLVICADLFDGVTFTLDHAGGSFPGETANGGKVEWTDVPAGPVMLQETNPGGYQDPRVFCHFFDGEQELIADQEEQSFIGLIPLVIPHDATDVACWVINIPNPDANSISVHKWLCPQGFDIDTDDIYTECTEPMDGVTFTLNDLEATTGETLPGVAVFPDLPAGDHQLTEVMPPGIVFGWIDVCTLNGNQGVIPLGGDDVPSTTLHVTTGDRWDCHFYNVQEEPEVNAIVLAKFVCPEGTEREETFDWYNTNCGLPLNGVEFRVTSGIGIAVNETAGGVAIFPGLPAGTAGIQETIPDGFGAPLVFCSTDTDIDPYPAPTGHWTYDFIDDGLTEVLECYVFNIPGEPGSLTLLKWTCPDGYDLFAAGADPKLDCTEVTNGVQFQFGLATGLGAIAELQTTGDLIDGGVVFTDLEPDTYKAVELVPDGIDHVFVLECTGHIMGVLQPYPLQMGNVLEIDVDAGEDLVCQWFNVPEPDGGKIVVTKYTCTTKTFVSLVDCQIEEGGVTFDLEVWNEVTNAWETIDTQVTDGFGQIAWNDLPAGTYRLVEHTTNWCHLVIAPPSAMDGEIPAADGETTVVEVFNCDGKPGDPGDTPTKYPNTGAWQPALDRRTP